MLKQIKNFILISSIIINVLLYKGIINVNQYQDGVDKALVIIENTKNSEEAKTILTEMKKLGNKTVGNIEKEYGTSFDQIIKDMENKGKEKVKEEFKNKGLSEEKIEKMMIIYDKVNEKK